MPPSARRIAAAALVPPMFVYHVLARIFWLGLNERNVVTLPFNFAVNFSPVFAWLLIFKNAGLIPKSIRPPIHVALAYHVDTFMYSVTASPIGSFLLIAANLACAWLLYLKFYRTKVCVYQKLESSLLASSFSGDSDLEMAALDADDKDLSPIPLHGGAPVDFQDHPHIPPLELVPGMTSTETALNAHSINRKMVLEKRSTGSYVAPDKWQLAPCVLLAALWFVLNFDHWLARPITTPKDIVSWFLYVIGHFCVPLFTAIWLYVFHAPGALKLFSFALGAQNIAGVLTHLAFPNAPPWFILLKGEHGVATYDTPGYAAGLTRAPFATGTHLVDKGFHASPIVFGALPSLHSAMAVMSFLFVSYYARWTFAKLFLLAFVVLQWWATIYLDHHWRLDLYVGMLYSLVLFTIFRRRMARTISDFAEARLRFDFSAGSTMGMRVFRNTKLQNFFDPMA